MVNNLKVLIKKNIKTFISILLLSMLGVGFFVGMKSTVPDLKYTIDKYYDDYNFYDLSLTSSIGFTKEEVEELSKAKGIKSVEGTYQTDLIVKKGSEEFVVRIHAYNNNDSSIKLELLKGKLPENDNEIAVEESMFNKLHYKLGDKINLNSNLLNNKELEIVGVIKSPLYLSNNKGYTNLLSGKINYYAYINEKNVNSDLYSNIYIHLDNKGAYDSVKKELQKIGETTLSVRYKDTIDKYTEELEKGQKEFDSKKKETEEKLNKYQREIDSAELQIRSAEESIPSEEEAEKILNGKKDDLSVAKKKLDDAAAQIEEKQREYDEAAQELKDAEESIREAKKEVAELERENNEEYDEELAEEIDFYKKAIVYAESELEIYKAKLADGKVELDAAKYEYELSNNEYQKAQALASAKSAKEIVDEYKRQVNDNKKLLESRKKELEDNKKIANEELEKYQQKLDDASDYLKLISVNSWEIVSREDSTGYSQYLSDINRIDSISDFFPVIFYLVAVLITLTNISRIIESSREEIGLYKALGYSRKNIGDDFIYFSLISCLIGSLIGAVVGTTIIPRVFYKVYDILYYLPKFQFIIDYKIIIIAIVIAVVLIVSSSYFSIKSTLKQWPVILLRPKESKKGQRVILEHINFIWNNISFTNKVTYRNMYKYPKRFIMTIIGISGCIALIISGFNMKTSISNIIPLQFENIFDINIEIFLKDSLSRSEIQQEKERISNFEEVDESALAYIKNVYFNDNISKANLVIPEDNDLLLDFVTLKEKNTTYELLDEGAIITKKIADNLNIKEDDIIEVRDSDNNKLRIRIVSIVDNYVENYLYISKNYYKKLLGVTPKYNALLVRTKDDNIDETKLSNKINENNSISYLVYTSTSKDVYKNVTKSLDYIVYILISSAILLAFIVLYNLNTLNVEERKREISTIKVLGFKRKECYRYIENEIKKLTFIGIFIGVILGYFFSNILIKKCELDNLMYDYSIDYKNYLYAIAITIVFMIITSLLGRKQIQKIDMIESLKKVE